MNDEERRIWVLNDEGLYCWWKQSRTPMKKWIKENRREIDGVINQVVSGKKPAHYLIYGG